MKPKSQSIIVSSLICHRDVPMALKCLDSLLKNSHEPISLILHDDGTLQESDFEILKNTLSSPKIIGIEESEERMLQTLKTYPNARQFRQTNIFAKKLLDCISFNPSEIFAYCDTDIYFFRPFLNLYALPDSNTNALFLRDPIHPYSIRLRDFMTASDIQATQHVNAGMVCFRKSQYDLDLIEWLLSKDILHSKPYFIEQTLWALMGQKVNCRLWDPKQLVFITPDVTVTDNTVAGHFVSPSRHLLGEYTERTYSTQSDAPVQIRTIPSKKCLPLDLAWVATKTEIINRLRKARPRPVGQ